MRLVWTILALLAAFPAWADSRLKLVADRPVVVVVNMVPYTVGTQGPVQVDFPSGKEGTQRVTVRNLAGQVMAQDTVVVNKGTVVTLAWRDKVLQVTNRQLLKTSPGYNRGRGQRVQKGHQRLDSLAQQSDEKPGDLLSLAAADVEPSPAPMVDEPAIAEVEPELAEAVVVEGSDDERVTGANSQSIETKVLAGGDAAGAASVDLVPRSQSWCNVWIGSEKVWEYRGKGDVLRVRLPSGTHDIVVKDFRDKDGWGSGTLQLTTGEAAELHFSMSDPIETKGGTWTPQEKSP